MVDGSDILCIVPDAQVEIIVDGCLGRETSFGVAPAEMGSLLAFADVPREKFREKNTGILLRSGRSTGTDAQI